MKVKNGQELLEYAAEIAAELFSCEKSKLTQRQLDFVLVMVLGGEK